MADSKSRFHRCVDLPVSHVQAFAYHDRPGALQRLIPPWESVTIEKSDNSLQPGSEVVLKTRVAGVPLRWLARHEDYSPPDRFSDIQVSGPFAHWHHEHEFKRGSDDAKSTMCDTIEYQTRGGSLGALLTKSMVAKKLDAMFDYRHRVTHDDLQMFASYDPAPLRVAVSGASGLVGSCLMNVLSLLGHSSVRLMRGDPPSIRDEDVAFPWSDSEDHDAIEGLDAVVHLAGKPIADKRWTKHVKQEIIDSRVEKTYALCRRLAERSTPPKVLICASAIGYYGDRGDEILSEDAPAGDGFLAEVGQAWEAACQPAIAAGIRVVNLRIGIVVSPSGGALEKLLLPAKLGVNGPVSHGGQWWSWIGIDDLVGAIYHTIHTESLSGPVNAVAPNPVTSADFAHALGRVLRRPSFIPAPALALKLVLGEMAKPLLLASTRVAPDKLLTSGYQFRFDTLEPCLRFLLGKSGE